VPHRIWQILNLTSMAIAFALYVVCFTENAIATTPPPATSTAKIMSFSDSSALLKQYYKNPAQYHLQTANMLADPNNQLVIIEVLFVKGHPQAKIGLCNIITQQNSTTISPNLQQALVMLTENKDKNVTHSAMQALLYLEKRSSQYWKKLFLESQTKAFNKIIDP